ncbi:LysM peptidoglycan-binding domain-containing protein [Tellurirhabdus bombi]|uniref:LysM peptidoglycan-binding domain-containing protein n=1 Tax=Tellurirhabdus bombi TaxID=2907205 RepID=UPI001F391B03|nr:LysM peptidoglycan-binding domain-containing protein [Tellurirhabdus bombi]
MKNLFLAIFLSFVTTLTFQQATAQTTPQVPDQVQFADMTVRFDNGAKRIIQQDINALILSNKRYWEAKLDRVVLYFPVIEAALLAEEIPTDFKYLAVQESSLTPDAVSASTAVGYWQFKKETATGLDMRVDDEVDERKSIVASTRGAARYLKRSNAIYNNWVSSLFSYYLGATGISKIVPADWNAAKEITLDERSDRYMLRFFAHKIALDGTLPAYRSTNTIALVEYPNGNGKTVAQISGELGVDEYEIRKYNRWILGDQIPTDKEYVLAIPTTNAQLAGVRQKSQPQQRDELTEFKKEAPILAKNETGFPVLQKVAYPAGKSNVVLYEINGLPGIQAQRGDNAASLARKSKISLSSFLRYNDMAERGRITEGEVYYLAKKMRKATVPYHTVRTGETSFTISQMYGLRLKRLLKFNRIDRSERLQVGRVMWLREKRPRNRPVEIINAPTPANQPTRPVVAQNDWGGVPETPNRTANNTIPKNASERKKYTPKLMDGASTSTAPAPQPQPTRSTPPAPVARPTAPKPNETLASSGPVNRSTTSPVSTSTTSSGANTQRVVIIRPSGEQASTTEPTPVEQPVASPPTTYANRTTTPTKTQSTSVASGWETTATPTGTSSAPITRPSVSSTSTASANAGNASTPTTKPTVTSRPSVSGTTKHTVEAGQTYYSISRLYNVTVEEVLAWNNLTPDDKLSVGQKLSIKGAGEPVEVAPVATKTVSTPAKTTPSRTSIGEDILYHTVQKGETMFRISKQYGVTVDQIRGWNELSDIGVKEGQRIKIIK